MREMNKKEFDFSKVKMGSAITFQTKKMTKPLNALVTHVTDLNFGIISCFGSRKNILLKEIVSGKVEVKLLST